MTYLLPVLIFLGVVAAQPARAQASAPGIPVATSIVQREDVSIPAIGLGTVRPYNSVTLTARVDGQVTKIDFVEGQEVHQGDVLVELDAAPLEAALAQAEALQSKDEALLANARLDLDRAQKLVGSGSGTSQQLDATRSQVAQLQAAIKADQANVRAAQTQLAYTRIVAPISGRVGARLIDAGNIVRASSATGIVLINQIRPITVEFDLPADALARVKASMAHGPLKTQALDRNDAVLAEGELTVIDNQVNVATNTIRFKARFPNDDETLWPGQFVTVRLVTQVIANALTIPITAVNRGPDNVYAFVVDETQHAKKQPIAIGFTNKTLAVVETGLRDGDRVVTEGQSRITAGTLVMSKADAETAPTVRSKR